MNYIGRLWSNISGYYSDINQATLTGAIDVIIIEQEDGTYKSTPLYVRFGKADILRPKNNQVELYVNGEFINIPITLGPNGEGYIGKPVLNDSGQHSEQRNSKAPDQQESVFIIDDLNEDNSASPEGAASLDVPPGKAMCKSDSELHAIDVVGDVDSVWGERKFIQRRRSISKRNQASRRVDPGTNRNEIYLSDINNSVEKNLYLYNNASPPSSVKKMVANVAKAGGFSHSVRSLPLDNINEFTEFSLSLCGGLDGRHEPTLDRFMEHLIGDQEFHSVPWSILNHPDLVIRWEGHYYSWKMVAPLIVSFLAFQKPLPDDVLQRLTSSSITERTSRRQRVSSWLASWSRPAVATKSDNSQIVTPESSPKHQPSTIDFKYDSSSSEVKKKSRTSSLTSDTPALGSSLPDRPDFSELYSPPSNLNNTEVCYSESDLHLAGTDVSNLHSDEASIRFTSDQIKLLNLSYGANPVVYSFTSQYRGTSQCSCYFYLWKHSDKVIISDIDGTITKSDVLGHIFPLVGKDWTQSGIVKLYERIQDNKYRFVYLSARAIGQAGVTRAFLRNVRQDNLHLPDGAVLLSPCSLVQAFRQEVIEKRPQEFKIACLQDLHSVFQTASAAAMVTTEPVKPFHAGFGNKGTDVETYKSLGIDPKLIFTVNRHGQLKNELEETSSMTYGKLNEVVNQYFPLVQDSSTKSVCKKISESGETEEDEAFVDSKNPNQVQFNLEC